MADYQNILSSLSIGTDPDAVVLQKGAACGPSTVSNDSYFSPIPPSPINDTYSSSPYSQFYGGNPLPSLPYDFSYSSSQQVELENVRDTPRSLEWGHQADDFLKLYKFVVPNGKLPYLELLDKWTPTYQTPRKVYLDDPK
jgi:hypothetical protein